jgi:hypothetical protein
MNSIKKTLQLALFFFTIVFCISIIDVLAQTTLTNINTEQRLTKITSELDSLKFVLIQIHKEMIQDSIHLQKVTNEYTELRKQHFDLKSDISGRHIDWASLVLAAIAVVAAFFVGITSHMIHQRSQHVSNIYATTIREARDHKLEIVKIQETMDELIRIAKQKSEDSKKELTTLVDNFRNRVEELKVRLEDEAKNQTQMVTENTRRLLNKEADRFRQTTRTSSSIALKLAFGVVERIGIVLEKEKLDKARDELFKENLYLYDLNSFIVDLTSDKKDERIRAVWGIEGMGTKENIKDLQEIANNKDEDPDIRVEAQRAVDNMSRRFEI